MTDHPVSGICLLVGITAALLLTVGSAADGATREVGPGRAYTTIQACINAAVAGDICNVHAATYTEQLSLQRSGSPGNVITVRNNSSEVVTVQSTSSPVVNINGKSYWTIDGVNITYTGNAADPSGVSNARGGGNVDYLTVKNLTATIAGSAGGGNAIKIMDSDHLTVTGVTMVIAAFSGRGVGVNGCSIAFASNLEFSGNTIYGAASETTGRLMDGCVFTGTNLNIENNVFHDGWAFDTHPDGIVIQGDGDRNGNNTANVRVARNTVYNFSQGIYFDAIHNPLEGDNRIENNVVYETSEYRYGRAANKMNGIVIDGESLSGPYYSVAAKVSNNTIGSKQVLFYIARTGTGTVIDVKNNIFVTPGYGGVTISTNTGVTLDYNYYSQANGTPIRWGVSVYSLAAFKAAALGEANSASGSVKLNADYTANSTSDSRGRGVNLSGLFTTDRVGMTRLSGSSAWDMGAYQFRSQPVAPNRNPTSQ